MNLQPYVENTVTCPYDPAHRILKHRFITHIVKCRRNYEKNNGVKVACLFNGSHIVGEPELQYHMETCPDRAQIDNFLNAVDDGAPRIEIKLDNNPPYEDEEDWDNHHTPSYNPEEYCLNNKIIRRLDTASKSQRKQFHANERLRFQELENAEMHGQSSMHPRAAPRNNQRSPKDNFPTIQPAKTARPPLTSAPPLSDILANANKPIGCQEAVEEKWETVKGRGRGRKIKH